MRATDNHPRASGCAPAEIADHDARTTTRVAATTTTATGRGDPMDPLTYLEIANQHLRELRVEAAHARLAAEARRARPRRSRIDWLRRIVRRWQRSSTTTTPATVTPTRRYE